MPHEKTEFKVKFGQKMRQMREKQGLTKTELALKLGVSLPYIGRWESGYNLPDAPILTKLCDLYGVELGFIEL